MRASLDVNNTMTRFDDHLCGQAGTISSRERRTFDPCLCQRRDELAHVHVRPATVARAGLNQRRRVE